MPMTPDEYKALFAPKVKAAPISEVVATNGHVEPVESNEATSATPFEASDSDFGGYTRKFVKEDWQTHDIHHLLHYMDRHNVNSVHPFEGVTESDWPNVGTANWSEMGCYKTSTGLWLLDGIMRERGVTNPNILIITSKGGKGTFYEAIPEILPEYTIVNIETQSIALFKNGQLLKLPKEHKFVPKLFKFPCVCIAHYPIFSRSNYGQFEVDEEGLPVKYIDDNGIEQFKFKEFTQADYIFTRKWDYVWCDEFHRLKDRNAKQTVGVKKIKTNYGRHGSTGTGFINRPHEIWSLLNWLDKKKYGSFWEFRDEYCELDVVDGVTYIKGVKPEKVQEFRDLVRSIGVRRTLSQVMPHIKEPIFVPKDIDLNPTQRRMYDQIKMELKALDAKGVELYAANVLALLQRLRQICVATPEVIEDYYDPASDRRIQKIKLVEPSSKLDEVMNILEELQWDDDLKEPLVVFSNFKDPLELLKARLNKHNQAVHEMNLPDSELYKYIHLEEKDSDVVRYRKWHDDFPTMQYRVFMSTLQLGGESINLTPAHHVVFLDRSWSPKDNSQGIGRIRRPGQEGQPVVIHLNAEDTTDEYIENVNIRKQGWFNDIFG